MAHLAFEGLEPDVAAHVAVPELSMKPVQFAVLDAVAVIVQNDIELPRCVAVIATVIPLSKVVGATAVIWTVALHCL